MAGDELDPRTVNQDNVVVAQEGNNVTVSANVDNLTSYALEEGGTQGKWIGIVIDTNEADITTVKCNDTAISADQVTEAESFELDADSYVEWIDASSFTESEYVYTKEGKDGVTITITLEDTGE